MDRRRRDGRISNTKLQGLGGSSQLSRITADVYRSRQSAAGGRCASSRTRHPTLAFQRAERRTSPTTTGSTRCVLCVSVGSGMDRRRDGKIYIYKYQIATAWGMLAVPPRHCGCEEKSAERVRGQTTLSRTRHLTRICQRA